MRYVLDSSVAFKWLVPEADTPKAVQLRDDFLNGIHELIAPDVFAVETIHALTRAERQKRVTPTQGAMLLKAFLKNLPQLFPCVPLLPRSYDLSSAFRIGVYDCVYASLAEREGCVLITADDRLVRNLSPSLPFITALSSI